MLSHCPNCEYDLAGLRAEKTLRCPECGGSLDEAALREQRRRRASRMVVLALVSPIVLFPLLLGGCLGLLLVWPVTTYFFYRALRLGRDAVDGRSPRRLTAMLTAVLAASGWLFVVGTGFAVVLGGFSQLAL